MEIQILLTSFRIQKLTRFVHSLVPEDKFRREGCLQCTENHHRICLPKENTQKQENRQHCLVFIECVFKAYELHFAGYKWYTRHNKYMPFQIDQLPSSNFFIVKN